MRRECVVGLAVAMVALSAAAKDFDARQYGAAGDGLSLDTAALQRAVDACAAYGGGRVVLERGRFLTGTITLKSGVDLHLDVTATLLGSADCADYPERTNLQHVVSENLPRERNACLIWAEEAHDIAISGRGTIDCNGEHFVEKASGESRTKYVRKPGMLTPPRVVFFAGCRDVRISDITMINQPAGWSFWITDCDRVWCERLRIDSNLGYPNNDGLHINCSRDVMISDSYISTSDDAIVVRANSRGLKANKACERVQIVNCSLRSACACIRIGYLNDGVVRDAVFANLTMRRGNGRGRGIRMEMPKFKIKPDRGREESVVERLSFTNIEMIDEEEPIHFIVSEAEGTKCAAVRDITFSNIRARSAKRLVFRGKEKNTLKRFTFWGCDFGDMCEVEMKNCEAFKGL